MLLENVTPKKLLKKYKTDDVIKLAWKMGFYVGTILNDDMKLSCFLISDKQSSVKKIVVDELQSGEWILFEVAYLISWYILRGHDKEFSVVLNYEDFFKVENSDIFDYSCELLLNDDYIRLSDFYVDNKESFKRLKDKKKVPDFILRRKITKIKEEIK